MPPGEFQRKRFNENEAWFLELICQSSLGKRMFWAPKRGTGPSKAESAFKSVLYLLVASVIIPEVGAVVLARPLRCWARAVMVALLGVAKKTEGLEATAVPGKLRWYQS